MHPYRGRFAPSPSGYLHFGSLVTAVGSYLDARHHGGEWLIRIEDVDLTRRIPSADTQILRTLEGFGFEWDGEVVYQSQRVECYQEIIDKLVQIGYAYPCSCSRKEISAIAKAGSHGLIYPGTCRHGVQKPHSMNSIRLRTQRHPIAIHDRLYGHYTQNLLQETGDFIIRRADGCFAYQLAVVIDDDWQNITHVVRGTDLLSSTPKQRYLQQILGLRQPAYLHLPLVLDAQGRKLSKQDKDVPLDPHIPMTALLKALRFLKQPLPEDSPSAPHELWSWAIHHWNPGKASPFQKKI
jgi:glutamyl-Q tRNA(Asp) synthetase